MPSLMQSSKMSSSSEDSSLSAFFSSKSEQTFVSLVTLLLLGIPAKIHSSKRASSDSCEASLNDENDERLDWFVSSSVDLFFSTISSWFDSNMFLSRLSSKFIESILRSVWEPAWLNKAGVPSVQYVLKESLLTSFFWSNRRGLIIDSVLVSSSFLLTDGNIKRDFFKRGLGGIVWDGESGNSLGDITPLVSRLNRKRNQL